MSTTSTQATQATQTTQSGQQPPHADDTELTTAQDSESQTPITRTVVIALDHSSDSQQAFDWSLKNFLRKETDLAVLVNVRPVPTVPIPYAAMGASYMDFGEIVASLEEQYRISSHTLLQEYAAKLKSHNFACKAIAMRGDARDEIVRKVGELNAEALILGNRGLGALKRTLLGSVSDYCTHNCHCTVIIVKEKVNQQHDKKQ
nr:1411_t:CDS:2 [Entrophospora candida]